MYGIAVFHQQEACLHKMRSFDRTDEEILAEKPALVKVGGSTVTVRPFRLSQYKKFMFDLGQFVFTYKEKLEGSDISKPEAWYALVACAVSCNSMVKILRKYYHVRLRKAAPDEIAALFCWTVYFNTDAVKKNIQQVLKTMGLKEKKRQS